MVGFNYDLLETKVAEQVRTSADRIRQKVKKILEGIIEVGHECKGLATMRLSEDQIKQGLLHSDKHVRFACLKYFAECFSRNQTVMPAVIEALERFGRGNAFSYDYPIADLAQTEGTIRWAIGELSGQPGRTEQERNNLNTLSRLLCQADPNLLLSHEKAIVSSPGFSREHIKSFTHRLKLMSWESAALWRELEVICEEGKDKIDAGKMRYSEAKQIVEALAREGDRHAARMMSPLAVKIENARSLTWMELLMVVLAGELRYEPAVPIIVGLLHEDAEAFSEECRDALVKIGTDGAVQAIREAYPSAEWHFRLYASGVLGRIHSDLAVEACIELLDKEKDLDLEERLARSLVEQFSFEGNEVVRKVVLDDPDLFSLQKSLVVACTLMEQHFPELDQWRKEVEETRQRKPLRGPDTPSKQAPAPALPFTRNRPVTAQQAVGRNDPCPCGSGKKYKKCCMNKGRG